MDSSPEIVAAAFVEVLEELTEEEKTRLLIPNFDIVEKSASRVHVRTWTKIEWLDSLGVSVCLWFESLRARERQRESVCAGIVSKRQRGRERESERERQGERHHTRDLHSKIFSLIHVPFK